MGDTLVLNSTYEPLCVIPWQRAICMFLDGRIDIIEQDSDRRIRSMKLEVAFPLVVRLKSYVKTTLYQKAKFSRINVFRRDRYKCQYCGDSPGLDKLTIDHVLPRSRGGRSVWENVVTCCQPCNFGKDNKTPEEAGLNLRSEPFRPDHGYRVEFVIQRRHAKDAWVRWLKDV